VAADDVQERLASAGERRQTRGMPRRLTVEWLAKPEPHDYAAAESYLSLIMDDRSAIQAVAKLKRAKMTSFKAKDIFRASSLQLLPLGNSHVKKDERKFLAREQLSPILLVRDTTTGKGVIADGYHRMCAVYAFDEDAIVPCKIV
jgi:hypothetical protein